MRDKRLSSTNHFGSTYVKLARQLTIRDLVVKYLKRVNNHQKVEGSIPVWGSEIIFSR